MTKQEIPDVRERVLTWSSEDQERVVRFVREIEHGSFTDDITDEEWKLIEKRLAQPDLATDEEVKAVFDRYRGA